MSVIGSNVLAGASGAAGAAAYEIERSLRFNSGDSPSLYRAVSTKGNTKTFTFACWLKKTRTGGVAHNIFSGSTGSNTGAYLCFADNTTNALGAADALVFKTDSGAGGGSVETDALFRDLSAWYHVVLAVDSTQTTATDRVKIWVNGVSQSLSQGASPGYPNQDAELSINDIGHAAIGAEANGSSSSFRFHGSFYLADIHLVDGQALAATDFGEYDDNVWQPKEYEGTYGTNGFKLDFSDNTNTTTIAEDSSGNNNDFTANNFSVASGAGNDSLIDTPTNYTAASGNNGGNYATLNPLDGSPTGLSNGNLDAASANAYPTIIPGSGQWYYEVNGTGYTWDGTRANFTPRSGSHNFGQRPFSGTPTTSHVSLCTTNLPDPTIADGSTAMDVKLYTGNGSTQTISGLGFSPDLVWIKNRAQADNHKLLDTVRGATEELESNTTDAEVTNTDGLTAFNSDGFDLGADAEYNTNTESYVSWTWDAGSSTVSNTDGDITSSVRANTSAGFSIVSYTGNGAASATIGHGLNAAPEMIMVKNRDVNDHGVVYHVGTDPTNPQNYFLKLFETTSGTAARSDTGAMWNDTAPTSSVFSVGTEDNVNASTENYIAYCFSPVSQYSAFGSYTGNGSTDGPFVYTGFKSALILLKPTSTGGNWTIFDTTRDPENAADARLHPNLDSVDPTIDTLDILSNGFKLRRAGTTENASGVTYIYAAFGDPFKTARAR